MHLPDIQLDTALALLPKESGLNSANALGGRIDAPGGSSGGDSFQKLLEKAMNDARAADKARDDERAARSRDARTRTDEAGRGADRTDTAENAGRSEIARHKENAGQTQNREIRAEISEDTGEAKTSALAEDVFAAKFRAATDDGLDGLAAWKEPAPDIAPPDDTDETSFKEQKIALAEDSLLLDALAAAEGRQELALAERQETAKDGAEDNPREDFESKKDSAAKRADARAETMAEAALFNARALNVNAAAVSQNAQTTGDADDAAQSETVGAAKKRGFFDGDKPLFTVIDERAVSSREKPTHGTVVSHEGNHAELQLSLSNAAKDARFTPDAAQNGGGAESKFAAMLSQEIKNNAYEFVKAGSIILRGNDSGSIRLALHPENLGDVKILLQLTDNNIAARITVATKEAYDAFKSSIDSLKQAFNDSGFSTGDFNLSWTGGGAQGNAQHNHHGQEPSRQTFERAVAQYAGGIPDYALDERGFTGIGGYAPSRANAVNIMA
jgi:flagellar hook-length control protein FliK